MAKETKKAKETNPKKLFFNKKLFFIVLAIIILISLLKFASPRIDLPPFRDYGAFNKDDQTWANSARSKALFNTWHDAEEQGFIPLYLAPLHTLGFYALFKLFGVSTFSMRLLEVVLSLFATVLLYFAVKEHFKDKFLALLSVFFFATNMILFVYSKSGLGELPLIFFMIITYFIVLKSFRKEFWLLLVGPVLLCCLLVKLSCFFFVIFTILFLIWCNRKNFRNIALLFAGGFVALLAFAILFVIPNFSAIQNQVLPYFLESDKTDTFSMPWPGLLGFAGKFIASTVAHPFFISFPFVFILASITLLYFISNNKKIKHEDAFVIVWLISGLLYLWLVNFQFRRLVPIIPPLCILAALSFKEEQLRLDNRGFFKFIFSAYIFLLLFETFLKPIVLLLFSYISFLFRFQSLPLLSSLASASLNTRVSLVAALVSGVLALALSLVLYFSRAEVKVDVRKQILLIIIFSAIIFGVQYCSWVVMSNDSLANASKELGQMFPAGTTLLSRGGGLLSLENNLRYINCESEFNYTNNIYFVDFVVDGKPQACKRIVENADYVLVKEWPSSQTITDEATYENVRISVGLFRITSIKSS